LAGHISKGIIRSITRWISNSKRPRGRSKQRWADIIKEDLRMLGVENAEELSMDGEK